jgi:methylmalonyl-CoA mutase
MTTSPDHGLFEPATRADWLRLAGAAATKGYRTYDGIDIEPMPAPAANAAANHLPRNAPKAWDVRALHSGSNPKAVRKAIAEDLAAGATSVVLQLATPGQFGLAPRYDAIAAALDGLPLGSLSVCFSAGDQYFGAAQCLLGCWDATGLAPSAARGAIHADPLGTLASTGALESGLWPALELLGQFVDSSMVAWPNVRLLLADGTPYHDAGASEAQELAAMLATLVEYLRVMSFESLSAGDVFPHLTVGLAADNDLFLTIAKLRAARLLIGRVAQACGAAGSADRIEFWVKSSQRMLTIKAPHTNVLRNSIAALGAVVGGADSISIIPHTFAAGQPDGAARRLACTTQALLKDESGLARVLDPAGGSAQVEALTDALARRAWSLFQDIEADGGMARALLKGSIQAGIAATAAKRIADHVATADSADRAPQVAHPPPAAIERAETRIAPMPPLRSPI